MAASVSRPKATSRGMGLAAMARKVKSDGGLPAMIASVSSLLDTSMSDRTAFCAASILR
jgi:hypothetical protein